MTDDLIFGAPFDLKGDFLPYNYSPATFDLLPETRNKLNRVLLVLRGNEGGDKDGRRTAAEYHVLSQETLKDPAVLEKYLDERGFDPETAHYRCFLGPPTRLEETSVGQALRMDFEPLEIANSESVKQVAIIIDIGIAFWNPAFRTPNGPRFRAMRYLDFDAFLQQTIPPGSKSPLAALPDYEIDRLCNLSDQPGGQGKVVAELGRSFPDSYFGDHGGAEPGTLWHGTAMADLMAGLPPDAPDTTLLMGIELPMTVLRDADGDALGAVLTTLLEGALEMTANQFSAVPLVIALPWGFTSGLQDGSHPFAVAIDRILALHSHRDVKLLLPMGNQLQDRCCAHLKPSGAAEPEQTVIWRLPPDDFSANSAEFHVACHGVGSTQTVRITAPNGQAAVILLKQAQGMAILRGGSIIGSLLRYKDTARGPRLRLAIGPTAWTTATDRPAFAGNWVLSFHHNDDVLLWILRDDRDWALDKAAPRRPSHLYDPLYRTRDDHGAYLLADTTQSAVVRAGTASVLATSRRAVSVQANETLGPANPKSAWYSAKRTSLRAAELTATADIGRQNAGVLAAANGTAQMVRVSGTSAAIALAARAVLGLPARPT